MTISSIDDVLAEAMAAKMTPTVPDSVDAPRSEIAPEITSETNSEPQVEEVSYGLEEPEDEYGMKVEEPEAKTYTEDEVNERINKAVRDRLSRMERNANPEQNAAIQKAKSDFEPNPESSEPWQAQLEGFIENTLRKRSQREAQLQQQHKEQAAHLEHQEKLLNGMGKYKDFVRYTCHERPSGFFVCSSKAAAERVA